MIRSVGFLAAIVAASAPVPADAPQEMTGGTVYAYGRLVPPPYVFSGMGTPELRLNGYLYSPLPDVLRPPKPPVSESDSLMFAEHDSVSRRLMSEAVHAIAGSADQADACRRALEIYRSSPDVESAEISGSSSLLVKFRRYDPAETIFLPNAKSVSNLRSAQERAAAKLRLQQAFVDEFRRVVEVGGIVAFGRGYCITRTRADADSLRAELSRIRASGEPRAIGDTATANRFERLFADVRQPLPLQGEEHSSQR